MLPFHLTTKHNNIMADLDKAYEIFKLKIEEFKKYGTVLY